MAEIPADVQAALDAYLAARTDDATWERYVNSLGPGVALDVATELCLWTEADEHAAVWIGDNFVSDPQDWDDPSIPESPQGLQSFRTLQDFLEADPVCESYRITLDYTMHDPRNGWNVTHTVQLVYEDWDAEGCYRAEESLAERARVMAHFDRTGEYPPRVDAWAVAACRAACFGWRPEWARAQQDRQGAA